MMNNNGKNALGIYVHIPFCVKKCKYCDFLSHPVTNAETHLSYIMKVIYELRARRASFAAGRAPAVDTVYIGGGTPSLLKAGFIAELLDAVYASYAVTDDAEITIEVNPKTVDYEKFLSYRAAGINRVSVGAQSFNARTLEFLGRVHTAQDTLRCAFEAREAGFQQVNLDLIFGTPHQTLADWEADLTTAVSLKPTHLSFYSLQIEEDTPLHEELLRGEFEQTDEILDRQMYHLAKDFLAKRGFRHYEISNSALEGCESRHNLKYWSLAPYAGFGAGAHSYFGGRRFSNTYELTTYLSAQSENEMTEWMHINTLSDDMSEFIFLGLRRTSGIELSRFNACFGRDFWELYGEETEKLIGRGLLEQRGDALRLTSLGLDLANNVFREYV